MCAKKKTEHLRNIFRKSSGKRDKKTEITGWLRAKRVRPDRTRIEIVFFCLDKTKGPPSELNRCTPHRKNGDNLVWAHCFRLFLAYLSSSSCRSVRFLICFECSALRAIFFAAGVRRARRRDRSETDKADEHQAELGFA